MQTAPPVGALRDRLEPQPGHCGDHGRGLVVLLAASTGALRGNIGHPVMKCHRRAAAAAVEVPVQLATHLGRGSTEAASIHAVPRSRRRRHIARATLWAMGMDAYKIVLYRQEDGGWVAEIPAIAGCYALMPTREEALAELTHVFDMLVDEYREKGVSLPEDTTEVVSA